MASDNDEFFGAAPRKAPLHEVGQNLDGLSVHELDERIAALRAEVTRLEEARETKQASLHAAAAFFKP